MEQHHENCLQEPSTQVEVLLNPTKPFTFPRILSSHLVCRNFSPLLTRAGVPPAINFISQLPLRPLWIIFLLLA